MTLDNFCARLDNVKGSGNQRSARCPAHDDRANSLSVGIGDNGGIVLTCHAGCEYQKVLGALGLIESDIMPDNAPTRDHKDTKGKMHHVCTYDYTDDTGATIAKKKRMEDDLGDKSFFWSHQLPDLSWVNKKPKVPMLYNTPALSENLVYIVEGEKDVDTLKRLGKAAVSAADGAGGKGKWPAIFNERFRNKYVIIIQDNDDAGKAFAVEIANNLHGIAQTVKLVDLTALWPDMPEKADITDYIKRFGDEEMVTVDAHIGKLPEYAPGEEPKERSPFLTCFRTLDEFEEEEATWLVPGWIPEGQITLMAADGGIGKTTIWCDILTALSNGTSCILDTPDHTRPPMKVAFMTTEDSVRKKLKRKLRLAGANESNIITPDFLADKEGALRKLKFGSSQMESVIRYFCPTFCVFDPVQGFVPPDINMGSRNAMRDCMAPLITLGEDCGTTFMVVCHTNKRKGAFGRDRIADSADLWDISRSVLMAGFTGDQGVRYLSNEKNNYAELQKTILFTIDSDGYAQRIGSTWKRDREYMFAAIEAKSAPKRDDCKEYILQVLAESGGKRPTKALESKANSDGYSIATIKRAKDELKADGKIRYVQEGGRRNKVWFTHLVTSDASEPETAGEECEQLPIPSETRK